MRQLLVMAPPGQGSHILGIAEDLGGVNLACLDGQGSEGRLDLVIVHLPNRKVEALMERLDTMEDLRLTLVPRGDLTLYPPAEEAPQQVTEVEPLSPIEIYLSGLQAKGSWTGFLGYAAAAGAVVWLGLRTGTIYLLTAAMLIAPFAGPAMNAAIGTARGNASLIGRSLLRYGAGLLLAATVSALLTLALHPDLVTPAMRQATTIDGSAVLLPLVAGAAGALNTSLSERTSLVSGAAVGLLVAASLAPPTGVVGMALAMGEWAMLDNAVFLLLLQLVGINLSGALVFLAFGLRPRGPRYPHGKRWVAGLSLLGSVLALGGLLAWQRLTPVDLERDSIATRVRHDIEQVLTKDQQSRLLDMNVRFVKGAKPDQSVVLADVWAESTSTGSDEAVKKALQDELQQELARRHPEIRPMVSVQVLRPPDR